MLGLAGTRAEVDWQLSQAAALGLREPTCLDYETNFWSQPTAPRRLSILPSRLAETVRGLGPIPWVARAGNGVIYHRGGAASAQAASPSPLLQRIKDTYDPKHILPDLSL